MSLDSKEENIHGYNPLEVRWCQRCWQYSHFIIREEKWSCIDCGWVSLEKIIYYLKK